MPASSKTAQGETSGADAPHCQVASGQGVQIRSSMAPWGLHMQTACSSSEDGNHSKGSTGKPAFPSLLLGRF